MSDLGHEDFEPVLNSLTPAMHNAQLRYLRSVFDYAVKRGHVDANPLKRLDFIKMKRKEVETVSAEVVEAMLRDALSHDRELLLPFLVLGFFCGLRTDGEMLKVQWSDICFEGQPQLTVRAEIAKTAQRRFVDLQPNTIAWLRECGLTSTSFSSSLILPVASHVIRDRRTAQHSRLGIRFPKNGMRHTFCSCWLAKFEDVNRLRMQTGHKSADMLFNHYNKGTKKAEAEKFWSIFP